MALLMSPPGAPFSIADLVKSQAVYFDLIPASPDDWVDSGGAWLYGLMGIRCTVPATEVARSELKYPGQASRSWNVKHRLHIRLVPKDDYITDMPIDSQVFYKLGDRDDFVGFKLTTNLAGTNVVITPVCSTDTGIWGYATGFSAASIAEHTLDLEVSPGTAGTVSCAYWLDGVQIGTQFTITAPAIPDTIASITLDNTGGAAPVVANVFQFRVAAVLP